MIIELLTGLAVFLNFTTIAHRRETYLNNVENKSSALGIGGALGYSAGRGTNAHLTLTVTPTQSITLAKYAVVGSVGDKDIILLEAATLVDTVSTTIDVVLGDHATLLNAMASEEGEFQIVDTFSDEPMGVAVPKDSDLLLARLNTIIDGLLCTDLENPVPTKAYNDMYKEWMEMDAVGYVAPETTIPGFSILSLIAAVPLGFYIIKRKNKL